MPVTGLDPVTPVVVGVGQSSERLDDPDYQALSPVQLAAVAARRALADTGAEPKAIPSGYGLVGANGGALSKYSVGIYSAVPTE